MRALTITHSNSQIMRDEVLSTVNTPGKSPRMEDTEGNQIDTYLLGSGGEYISIPEETLGIQ